MTTGRTDFYGSYRRFAEDTLRAVREETFGTDIGQNSWLTVGELDRFAAHLDLAPDRHVLDVACGSGGPSRHLAAATGCRVTGIDVHEDAIITAAAAGGDPPVEFRVVDAAAPLPFEDDTFDAVLCIDAINHLEDRGATLHEWCRVLRPGARLLFTDPVVVTGPVTNAELAERSAIGFFLFLPPGVNERLLEQTGFRVLETEDRSENAARVSRAWHAARERRREDLVRIEGENHFADLQRFFDVVHHLSAERRLSRIAYVAEKRA